VATATKLEYFALMACDLEFIPKETYDHFTAELIEVKKMLNGFGAASILQTSDQLS
jgi:hypothetical protein